ncbi:MAG: hypothetical protein WCE68_05155 [Anaerolineales bacterium]
MKMTHDVDEKDGDIQEPGQSQHQDATNHPHLPEPDDDHVFQPPYPGGDAFEDWGTAPAQMPFVKGTPDTPYPDAKIPGPGEPSGY